MTKVNFDEPATRVLRRATHGIVVSFLLIVAFSTAIAQNRARGPHAILDALSDAGDGKISISWSLSTARENEVYVNEYPDKVCAKWAIIEDGAHGEYTTDCFTEGISTQSDLEIDTGLGANGPKSEYAVFLTTYYGDVPLAARDGVLQWKSITLNASNSG